MKTIRITEKELHRLIYEAIDTAVNNANMNNPNSLFVANRSTQTADRLRGKQGNEDFEENESEEFLKY